MFEDRAVDPGMRGIHASPVDPFALHRIGAAVLEDEDRAVLVVLEAARGRRIIEIPFPVEPVQFGRPDAVCVRPPGGGSPHDPLLGICEVGDIACPPEHDAVAERVRVIIEAVHLRDPRIGARGQQRVGEGRRGWRLRTARPGQHRHRHQHRKHRRWAPNESVFGAADRTCRPLPICDLHPFPRQLRISRGRRCYKPSHRLAAQTRPACRPNMSMSCCGGYWYRRCRAAARRSHHSRC